MPSHSVRTPNIQSANIGGEVLCEFSARILLWLCLARLFFACQLVFFWFDETFEGLLCWCFCRKSKKMTKPCQSSVEDDDSPVFIFCSFIELFICYYSWQFDMDNFSQEYALEGIIMFSRLLVSVHNLGLYKKMLSTYCLKILNLFFRWSFTVQYRAQCSQTVMCQNRLSFVFFGAQ